MPISRRSLFGRSVASLPVIVASLATAAAPARAEEVDDTTDYPMAADPALVPALRAAAAAYRGQSGITIHILPTAPALLVPQMTHQIQNDIVMAREDIVAELDRACCFVDGTPRPHFANRYVLAARDEAGLKGSIAFTDISIGRPRDETQILAALGLGGARRIGCLDSLDAAAMAASGAAGAALCRASDVAANPELKVQRVLPNDIAAPDIHIATVTRAPRRPRPEGFVSFLAAPAGQAIMARFGLEKIA